MTGEDLKLSGTRADFDTSLAVPAARSSRWSSRDEVATSSRRSRAPSGCAEAARTPQHFAIVLDREIRTFPQIDYTDSSLSGGIGGGRAQITGLDSIDEAQDIAIVQTGALPVKFETLDRTDISATLGKDSLEEAWKAAIGGILLVAIFLLLFYRFLGLVAVTGLVVYAAFLYATILLFNVTLTLPGFAGLVLTFGVAADANIVIFERIKEEVRAGRSVRAAINLGYKKGFATIVDANVVTAITAMVLFAVATASVRGFALMLLIGTALSMLTAVLATRAILALLAGFGWIDNPRLMGTTGGGIPRWLRLDYIGGGTSGLRSRNRRRDLDRRDPVQGTQPRDRLQGRDATLVPHAGAHLPRGGAKPGGADRPARRRDPGARTRPTAVTRTSKSAPSR